MLQKIKCNGDTHMFNLDLFICLRADIAINLDNDIIKLVKTHNSTNETLLYISKTHAIILSLFDGTKTVEQVINMLSFLFKITPEKSCKAVFDIIETYSGQLEYSDAPITKIASVNVKDVIKCHAKSPTKYLSPIVRRKIQRLVLFITDACAAKCIYCCIGDSIRRQDSNSLTLSQIEDLLIQAKELQIPEVEITGGDPFVHKDIISVLQLVVKYGFELYVSTKVPISFNRAKILSEIGVKKISLSLDTIEPDIYEQIIGIDKKYLAKTLNGIEYLTKHGIECTIKVTITSLNIRQIPYMIEQLYSKYSCTNFMLQAYSRGDCYVKQLFADKKEYLTLDGKINELIDNNSRLKITKAYNIEKIIGSKKYLHMSRMICMAGKNAINVYSTGKYGFCAHSMNNKLTYGDINQMSLRESWYSKDLFKFLKPTRDLFAGKKCEKCADFEECNKRRCYVRTLLEFNELFNIDPLCPHSEIDF